VFWCLPLLSSLEKGKSSRGGGFKEVCGSPGVVIDLNFCFQTLGDLPRGECEGLLT
jgi:hypothetical protein